jgi:hypothetical protein
MKQLILTSILFMGLFSQCQKNVNKESDKIIQINAENNYDLGEDMTLNLYSDSTYSFVVKLQRPNYEKIEKFNGRYIQSNDTVDFYPFRFDYNRSTKAIIKNNFVEFIDGESPLKIEIKKNKLGLKGELDFENFMDYAIFTFNPKFYNPRYFGDVPSKVKAYDLKQGDLVQIDRLLKKCFHENANELNDFNNYIKQCIPIINSNGEREVWISCFCKNYSLNTRYKTSIIIMNDGGNCNISLKINLNKNEYSELNIAGEA